jgi:hypothetical protein
MGHFPAFQRFCSSKLVLKTVESRFLSLKYFASVSGIKLSSIESSSSTLRYVNSQCINLEYVNLQCINLECVNLQCINLPCVNLQCINFECVN